MNTLEKALAVKKERELNEIFRESLKDCTGDIKFWGEWVWENKDRLAKSKKLQALMNAADELMDGLLEANRQA